METKKKKNKNSLSIVIPVHKKDIGGIALCIDSLTRHLYVSGGLDDLVARRLSSLSRPSPGSFYYDKKINQFRVPDSIIAEIVSLGRKKVVSSGFEDRKRINHSDIYVIASCECIDSMRNMGWSGEVNFIDENDVYDGINLQFIMGLLGRYGIELQSMDRTTIAGWYLQQFIKLYFSYRSDQVYMVFDSDLILIRDLVVDDLFFNALPVNVTPDNGFISTHFRLFSQPNFHYLQFMCEFMIFVPQLVRYFLESISDLGGGAPVEKILRVVSFSHESGFSEFESYANFIFANTNAYSLKTMPVLRIGGRFYDSASLHADELSDIADYYYVLEFNHWDTISPYAKIIRNKLLRRVLGIKNLLRIYHITGQYRRDFHSR